MRSRHVRPLIEGIRKMVLAIADVAAAIAAALAN
jgi:hypothetical protein